MLIRCPPATAHVRLVAPPVGSVHAKPGCDLSLVATNAGRDHFPWLPVLWAGWRGCSTEPGDGHRQSSAPLPQYEMAPAVEITNETNSIDVIGMCTRTFSVPKRRSAGSRPSQESAPPHVSRPSGSPGPTPRAGTRFRPVAGVSGG